MSNSDNSNNNNFKDRLKKNEEAKSKAPVTSDGLAIIWQNPTTGWTEFEVVEKESTVESSSDSNAKKLGFIRGNVSPSGNVIFLTFPDGDLRQLNVKPSAWDSDYESSMKDKIQLMCLERARQEKNNPELSLKVAMEDPMFKVRCQSIVQKGKAFLSMNIEALRVNLDSGKRGKGGGGGGSLKKHKRLTVGGSPETPEDPTVIIPFLQNYGEMPDFNKVKIDKKLTIWFVDIRLQVLLGI